MVAPFRPPAAAPGKGRSGLDPYYLVDCSWSFVCAVAHWRIDPAFGRHRTQICCNGDLTGFSDGRITSALPGLVHPLNSCTNPPDTTSIITQNPSSLQSHIRTWFQLGWQTVTMPLSATPSRCSTAMQHQIYDSVWLRQVSYESSF